VTPAVPWGHVRRIVLLFAAVWAVEYTTVHLVAGARRSWPSLGSAAPLLVVAALVAELASLACFSRLTYVLLSGRRPPYSSVLAIDVTGNGFSHLGPGSGAAAVALRVGLYAREAVDPPDAVSAAAVQYALNLVWLVAVLVLGLVVTVPSPGTEPLERTASVLAAVSVTALAGLVAVLVARPDQVVAVSRTLSRRLPLVRPDALERLAVSLVAEVRLLIHDPRASRHAALWAMGYWTCDALSLHLSLSAFGDVPGLGALLTTYALVSLVALLPLTPGGLGLVEGAAIPLLVSFGTPHDTALLGGAHLAALRLLAHHPAGPRRLRLADEALAARRTRPRAECPGAGRRWLRRHVRAATLSRPTARWEYAWARARPRLRASSPSGPPTRRTRSRRRRCSPWAAAADG
jgi:uncharacterized protein (TIRG00374 family)